MTRQPVRAKFGQAWDDREHIRLMRDSLRNNLGLALPAVVGILLVPILLHGLGAELYGLFLAALAMAGLARVIDFGLGWTLTREIASARGRSPEITARLVATIGNIYLTVGLAGALLIAALGLPMSQGLKLSGASQAIAPAVFGVVGLGFISSQVLAFAIAVLHGLRDFAAASRLTIAAVLLGATGIAALLLSGAGLLAVVTWQTLAATITALVGLTIITQREPLFRLHLRTFDWRLVRTHLPFGLQSQFSTVSINMLWEALPLLIGLLRGSAAIVPYHVGQKFPLGISAVSWRTSEVLFPASSEQSRIVDGAQTRALLRTGTRWNVAFILPFCLVLFILAPTLLQAWLGGLPPGASSVFRLLIAAVFVDALSVGSIHVLWGLGATRAILWLVGSATLGCLVLTAWLVHSHGIVGAAVGVLLALAFRSVAILRTATRKCTMEIRDLLTAAFAGLLLPALACGSVALGLTYLAQPRGWAGILLTALVATAAYALSIYRYGAREAERRFAAELLSQSVSVVESAYRGLRRRLRGVRSLRRLWYLLHALTCFVRDPWRSPAAFDREFARRCDPWDYAGRSGQARFQRVVGLLDSACAPLRSKQGLEVGCAEGHFTELLAPRFESLLAVDFSALALARACERCRACPNVRFEQWDLRRDLLPGTFDVVVVMDVLSYFNRPRDLHAARAKLVEAVRPRGYLLLGDVRQGEISEAAWWGHLLLRGGKWITAFFAKHPALRVVTTATDDSHIHTLLQKEL